MLARFVDRRRLNAVLMVVVGVAVPPAFLIGGASIGLTTLRRGLNDGAFVAVAGWSIVAGLVALGGGLPLSLPVLLVMSLAVAALASMLRYGAALATVILAALAAALLALAGVWVVLDDPVAFWQATFAEALDRLVASGAQIDPVERERLMTGVQLQAFTGNLLAGLMLLVVGGVFIARNWQARLVNPGGFARDFYRLQLGRVPAVVTAVLFMATALVGPGWLLNAAAIVIWIWVIQGLSVIHAVVAGLKASAGWLVATYLILVFGWSVGLPVAILVPMLGMLNQFIDLRSRWLRHSDNGE